MTRLSTSYWPADTSAAVMETTVGGILRAAAASRPDMLAMVGGLPDPNTRKRWTYAQLLEESERAARALIARFAPGERLAAWAPNLPEWVVLEYAAGLAGLVLVTVNPAFRPAELAYILNQSGAAGIFLVPEFRSPMAELLKEVRPDVPSLREVVFFTDWNDFLNTAPTEVVLPEVQPDDIAQIKYTSGTTGFPKGAELSHRGLTNNARFYAERIGLRPGEVYVNPMALFHTAGCVLGVLGAAQRGAVHVPVLNFDPALVLELCETEQAAVLAGVPTMMIALLGHPDLNWRDLSSLRAAVSGGAPVPAELVRRVEERLGVRFSIVFGTAECSPLLTQVKLDDSAQDRAETLGSPLPQTEVQIADTATGGPVPVGEVGELCARGYLVMRGYHNAPEATATVVDTEGWYHTGDLASLDARGYLRIEGRIKDMIIRGGENIYPREIEDVLFDHPAVAEAAVIGVPDEKWGEVVAAYVRPVPGQPAPVPEELQAHCRERLAPYKTPLHWVFVDAFPMAPSGEIQKFKLQEDSVPHESAPGSEAVTALNSPNPPLNPVAADYWLHVKDRWSESVTAANDQLIDGSTDLHQQRIQFIQATVPIAVTGMRGAGKSVIYDALVGRIGERYQSKESKKVERHRVKIAQASSKIRARLAVVPGQASRPRNAALSRMFLDGHYTHGVVHVVNWGFPRVWDEDACGQILKWLRFRGRSTDLGGIREKLLTEELDDFQRTCRLMKSAWMGKAAEFWLIIAVTKCDLYWPSVEAAGKYYIPGSDPNSDSPFAKELRSLIEHVERPRLAVLPVSCLSESYEFNGQFLAEPGHLDNKWRAALLSQLRNTLGEFNAT